MLKRLQETDTPLSGTALAKEFHVSRQIIVQDIALIRAENYGILSTNKGYLLRSGKTENMIVAEIFFYFYGFAAFFKVLHGFFAINCTATCCNNAVFALCLILERVDSAYRFSLFRSCFSYRLLFVHNAFVSLLPFLFYDFYLLLLVLFRCFGISYHFRLWLSFYTLDCRRV